MKAVGQFQWIISLAPRFSAVSSAGEVYRNRLNGFQFECSFSVIGLKPGANERDVNLNCPTTKNVAVGVIDSRFCHH
jgi:hypothetical protein